MLVTDIYKKLPKTNCGECGEPACIAFALLVQTGQRKITDCPYVEGGDAATAQDNTVSDSYEETSNALQAKLPSADFEAAAQAIGAEYDAQSDVITMDMVSNPIEVRREGLFETGEYCRDSWSKLIVYDYVLRKGNVPLANEWVPFEHFPKTPSHVKAFQKRAEAELAQVFEKDAAGLRALLAELGAVDTPGETKTDLACSLMLLPRFPFYLQFWAADDEFPVSCKLFVDLSAISYLDIEYIARLVSKCVARLVGHTV